ncbi:hypothetical protein BH11PSE2_BH11PSE2_21190 [soil metagenome]
MTLTTEPKAETDLSRLPGDPSAYRTRGSGPRMWLIVVGVAIWTVICVGGALWVVATFGSERAAVEQNSADAATTATKAAARPLLPIFGRPAPAAVEPAPVEAAVPVAPRAPAASENAALAARVERLEADQRRTTQAAAASLAAASLAEAAQSAAPFDAELAALSQLLPGTVDLRPLQRLAREGAPTRVALSAEFTELAAKAAVAARTPAKGSGVFAGFAHALSSLITIRRIDASGDSSDAALTRAQAAMGDGDLEGALKAIDKLPAPARDTLSAWRARVQRRVDIDRQVSAIRAAAMRELSISAGVHA